METKFNVNVIDLEPKVIDKEKDIEQLIEAISAVGKVLTETRRKLLPKFKQEGVNLNKFYQKNFKEDKLIDSILPLYAQLHKAANERSKNGRVHSEDSSETEAYLKLRSIEQTWDQFILDVDNAMAAKYRENDQDCIEFIDNGTIRMMDCEKMREVALRDVLNPKFGHYTLFVLLRFFG
uniref:Uncharacterized protein n=1 Tax=Plectus sambesii TaxID=2011161 RepID=A0A914UUQ0_9BILA